MKGEAMGERIKQWWEWLPGWWPVIAAAGVGIAWGAMTLQSIKDQIVVQGEQIRAIQDYIRHEHKQSESIAPPISSYNPQQDASIPSSYQSRR